jgi:hypothetical protein
MPITTAEIQFSLQELWHPGSGRRSQKNARRNSQHHMVKNSSSILHLIDYKGIDNLSVWFSLQQACSTFYVMNVGNFGKISSAYRQHEIQYTELRMNKYRYNCMYNFNSVCVHTSFAIQIYYNKRKH